MAARIFLSLTGLMYLALAVWCSVSPTATSQKVGFSLVGDSGRSEFLTVYGGLEFGLALIFLMPLVNPQATHFSLWSCLLIHGSLVVFRSISLLMYHDFSGTTARLAIGEWVLLLASVAILWFADKPAAS